MNFIFVCGIGLLWTALSLTAAAPGVIGGDSPELTAAAFHLGPAHAPGYPLYVLLGRLFTLLPLGTPAFRMTFLSILAQLGATLVLAGTFRKLLGEAWSEREKTLLSLSPLCLLMAGTLTFAQTLSPEVIALHFLILSLLLRSVLFPDRRGLWAVAFVGGLALSHHHLSLLLFPAILWAFRDHLKKPKVLFLSSAFFILGLSCYLLLPIRAIQGPLVNWGNPAHWRQFLYQVSRAQYGGDLTHGPLGYGFLDLYLFIKCFFLESYGLGPLLLLLGIGKGRPALKPEYYLGAFSLLVLHPFLIRAPYEAETNFVNGSFLPPLFLWLSPLVLKGSEWLAARGKPVRGILLTMVLLGGGLLMIFSHIRNDSARNFAVTDVTQGMLLQMPARSILYSDGDAVTFPLAYSRLVLGLRPDLAIFDRTGGLFEDLYHLLDYRDQDGIRPEGMVRIERANERDKSVPAVFYSETDRLAGRPVSMGGLLFQVTEGKAGILPAAVFWEKAREPRITADMDYFSRETAARFFLFRAGFDLGSLRRVDLAKADLKRAKDLAFDNGRVWINSGVVENDQGWIDEAAMTFETACRLIPGNYLPWYDRGSVAVKQGLDQVALSNFEQAVRLAPATPEAHFRLAFQYYKAQRFPEAAKEWETTRVLAPQYADAYRNLGFLYMQSKPDYAAGMFREYLQLDPQSPDRAMIEKFLSGQAGP